MLKEKAYKESYTLHYPVMLEEMLSYLAPIDGGKYLDCTFGAGGYSRAILDSSACLLTAVDQDPGVEKFAEELTQAYKDRFRFVQSNFADANCKLKGEKFDGVVLDLGVSSMQIDSSGRGFSFMQDGPLDMRMGQEGVSASDFIASASEEEIANIIYRYGEEVQSRQIAAAIVAERAMQPITTTSRLAEIVRQSMHYRKAKIDPATKTFQAIRIYINKELESLEMFLANLDNMLVPGGRIVVVSFHSLEDSIVKEFFKDHSVKKVARSKYSRQQELIEPGKWLKIITKKPIAPSEEEIKINYRSRSAKLRVAQKIQGGLSA